MEWAIADKLRRNKNKIKKTFFSGLAEMGLADNERAEVRSQKRLVGNSHSSSWFRYGHAATNQPVVRTLRKVWCWLEVKSLHSHSRLPIPIPIPVWEEKLWTKSRRFAPSWKGNKFLVKTIHLFEDIFFETSKVAPCEAPFRG